MSSGPSPAPVFVAALLVLIGGIAALVVHDDGHSTGSAPARSSSTGSSSASSATTRTTRPPITTAPTTSFGATTVRPAVTSPEAAANGLWAAYTAANRTAAQRFATDDVIQVLFEEPYNGQTGTFQSCRPQSDGFDCEYRQPSARYSMIVKVEDTGSFKVVELTVSPPS